MTRDPELDEARRAVWRAMRHASGDDLGALDGAAAASLLRSGDPLPLYYQIYLLLRRRIMDDDAPPPTTVPSQNRLAETFGVCRATASQALNLLAREGLIERLRGVGNRVIYARPSAHWLHSADLRGSAPSTRMQARTLDLRVTRLVPSVLEDDSTTGDVTVFEHVAVWSVNGEAVSLERRWVVCDEQAGRPATLDQASFEALCARLDLDNATTEQTVQVEAATPLATRELSLNAGEAVMRTRRRAFDRHGVVLEFAEREHHPRRCGLVLN